MPASISTRATRRKRVRGHTRTREMVRFSQVIATPAVARVKPEPIQRMLQFRRILIASVVAVAACASGPQIRKLGDYGSANPLFTTPPNQKTPREITVNLTQPAYVAALFVVPGRGAVIVYPTDTAMTTHVDAGSHTIPVHFAETPFNRDSMLAAIRRNSQGGTRRNPQPTIRPDTMRRDSIRVRGDTSRLGGLRGEPGPGASPIGYLLLVASPTEIPLATLQRRINGITIPIDDDEALSTVMKLVKAALPDGTNLAGYARELDRT